MSKIENSSAGTAEYSTFYIGKELFGIDILDIQEINKQMEITRVPEVPDEIKGILNLRGRIITVFDLGKKLGLKVGKESEKERRNIVVKSRGEHFGLIVDRMEDVVSQESKKLEPVPSNLGGVQGKYFKGVLKTEKRLIGILDIDEVLK